MINFTYENEFLKTIGELEVKGRISPSGGVANTEVKTTIHRLMLSTKQRMRASAFYLTLMENMDYIPYLKPEHASHSSPIEPLIEYSDTDFQIIIKPESSEAFPLALYLVIDGYFSNLISSCDSFAKIVNIIYNCIISQRYYFHNVRDSLITRIPNGKLTSEIRTFHPFARDGSSFNIAKAIRNQLTHDILDVIDFPQPLTLYGHDPNSDRRCYFKSWFFPTNTPKDRMEIVTFCSHVHNNTVSFIDNCYEIMRKKLHSKGCIPV